MLPDLRWFWSITVYVDAKRGALPGNALRAWMRLKRNSSRIGSGAAPTRLRPDSALLSCRHVVASACPAGGLRRAVPPTTAPHPPSGEPWLHEIKHDGFRVIARKNGHRVKLYSRSWHDLTSRFPLSYLWRALSGAE
jgi:hypothetical protein